MTDPVTGAALEVTTHRYRPTRAMADTVAVLDGVCRAPAFTTPAHRCDLDHERRWTTGAAAVRNLSAKHRRHHHHKTRVTWTATSDEDGSILWRTASRRSYVTQRHPYHHVVAGGQREGDRRSERARPAPVLTAPGPDDTGRHPCMRRPGGCFVSSGRTAPDISP